MIGNIFMDLFVALGCLVLLGLILIVGMAIVTILRLIWGVSTDVISDTRKKIKENKR